MGREAESFAKLVGAVVRAKPIVTNKYPRHDQHFVNPLNFERGGPAIYSGGDAFKIVGRGSKSGGVHDAFAAQAKVPQARRHFGCLNS